MMKPPFSIEYQEITPAMAADWLATKNIHNRALRHDTVAAFARDMLAGEWIPNHQGIAFGDSGNLIDGQHRLAGIVKSGVTLRILVCRDVPEKPPGRLSTMGSIDRGAPRSIGDILRLQHGFKKNQAFAAALVTSTVMLSLRDTHRVGKCSINQTLAVLELFPDDARWIIEKRPQMKIFNGVGILAPFAWARPLAPAIIEAMLDKFIKGTGLVEGDPMLGLRNYVLSNSGKNKVGSDGKEGRLRMMEVVLHCLWHGIHQKALGAQVNGVDGKRGLSQITWFRDKRKDFIDKIEAIFPVISEAKIVQAEKSPEPKPEPTPEPVVVTAKDFKMSPYAESLVKGMETSERIHKRIPGQTTVNGKTRKELIREIAHRVR